MNDQMLVVMLRRGKLLERIAVQREQAAEFGSCLQAPLALADQGMAVVRFLRSNPIVVAAMTALLVIRRRTTFALLMGAWRVWKGYRQFSDFSEKSPPP